MRRIRWFAYFLFAMTLIGVMTLGDRIGPVRSWLIGQVSPYFGSFLQAKERVGACFLKATFTQEEVTLLLNDLDALERDNKALTEQLDNVKQWLLHEDRIEEQMIRLEKLGQQESRKEFFLKRREQLAQILQLQTKSLPAKVVYREPCSWSSFLWINLGEKHNRALGEVVIAKNSPVVFGNILVGVIEEVKESLSKVRLISDARLIPSVRAVRGPTQHAILQRQIEALSRTLQERAELFASEQEGRVFFAFLERLGRQENSVQEDAYLAKGELYGSSFPLWRSRGQKLKGVGFNYDFADEEGLARDLRMGVLLKEGDLLVTSGLDGLFPSGLEVATVSKVECLREGACSYQIEAISLLDDLHGLSSVFVLPPLVH